MEGSVQQPLVSVYIPSYNASDTLEKAVRSALAQMQDMEVIIVDDCSTDSSFEVAKKIASEDKRVKLFGMQRNSGVAAVRNFALGKVTGKWVACLDSDDWYEEGRIEKLIAAAESENVDMAADNQYFFDKHANRVSKTSFPASDGKEILDTDIFLANSNATKNFDYGMLKPVFRADFLRRNSLAYHEAAKISEDYYMLLEFFTAGGKAVLLHEPLYYYVQPFGSLSGVPQNEGRKHYNHELQRSVHQHFAEKLKNRLSQKQVEELQRRGREIDSLISYYKLREALKKKDIKIIVVILTKTTFEFWKMIAAKVMSKLGI